MCGSNIMKTTCENFKMKYTFCVKNSLRPKLKKFVTMHSVTVQNNAINCIDFNFLSFQTVGQVKKVKIFRPIFNSTEKLTFVIRRITTQK